MSKMFPSAVAVALLLSACGSNSDKRTENEPFSFVEDTTITSVDNDCPIEIDDRSLFEVQGNVKKVQTITILTNENGYPVDFDTATTTFYKDGLLESVTQPQTATFDREGVSQNTQFELTRNQIDKISSFTWKTMATPNTYTKAGYEYFYNNDGQLIKMISHGIDSRSVYEYVYDGNDRVTQMVLHGEGEGSKWESLFTYEYLAADEHGNWLLAIEKACYKTYVIGDDPRDVKATYTFNPIYRNIEYFDCDAHSETTANTETATKIIADIQKNHDDMVAIDKHISHDLLDALRSKEAYEQKKAIANNEPGYKRVLNVGYSNEVVRVKGVIESADGDLFALVHSKVDDNFAYFVVLKFKKENNTWKIDDFFDNSSSYFSHQDLSFKFGIRDGSFLKDVAGNFDGKGCSDHIWVYNPKIDVNDPSSSCFYIYSGKPNVKLYKSETNCLISKSVFFEYINTINARNLGDLDGDGKEELGILYHGINEHISHYAVMKLNDNGNWDYLVEPIDLYEEELRETEKIVEKISCKPGILKILTHKKNEDGSIEKVFKEISFAKNK